MSIGCGTGNTNINVYGGGNVYVQGTVCNIQAQQQQYASMGKVGDIHTIAQTGLPQQVGINKFTFRSNTTQENIQGPKDQSGVLFTFVTNEGIANNFLIRRIVFDPSEMARWDNKKAIEEAKNMITANAGKTIYKTEFLHNKPNINQEWKEIRFDLNPAGSFASLEPTFNAQIFTQAGSFSPAKDKSVSVPAGTVVLSPNNDDSVKTYKVFNLDQKIF
jgi:hypothetical protein